MAQELDIAGSLVVVPAVTDEPLAEACSAAVLLVYPSLWEGFGFPPLEAMHLGCPVLACKAPTLPEMCSDAPFYFEAGPMESPRDALLRAVSDQSARSGAVAQGKAVAATFSWQRCASKPWRSAARWHSGVRSRE